MCWKVDFFVSMDFWSKRSKMLSILSNFNCLMSWCHDVMLWRHKTWFIIYLSQLVDVLETWFFFVSMVCSVNKFKIVINYLLVWGCDVTTSCHDVTNPDVPISACRCARKVIDLFCFYGFFGQWLQKFYQIFNCSMSWRHDVMS